MGHAVGTRIHPEEDDALRAVAEAIQIPAMTAASVHEWVVDVRHRGGEAHRLEPLGELARGSDEAVCMAHGLGIPLCSFAAAARGPRSVDCNGPERRARPGATEDF